jgi:hypothetical protein
MSPDIERIWTAARDRRGNEFDNRTPSRGIRAVLAAMADGPAWGGEIARRAGQDQGNTCRWLFKLELFGFVAQVDTLPACQVKRGKRMDGGRQSGGRPAVFWRLTRAGGELAEALAVELAHLGVK